MLVGSFYCEFLYSREKMSLFNRGRRFLWKIEKIIEKHIRF